MSASIKSPCIQVYKPAHFLVLQVLGTVAHWQPPTYRRKFLAVLSNSCLFSIIPCRGASNCRPLCSGFIAFLPRPLLSSLV